METSGKKGITAMKRKRDDFIDYNNAYRQAADLVRFTGNHLGAAKGTVRMLREQIESLIQREENARYPGVRSRFRNQRLRLSAQLSGFIAGYKDATGVDLWH